MECVLGEGCAPSSCSCENAKWQCTEDCGGGVCVDKTGSPCGDDELKTVAGCKTCDEALAAASAEVALHLENSKGICEVDKDCVMVSASTDCYGTCPVAVTTKWAVKYVGKVGMTSEAYCTGFQDLCPYATPDCMPSEPSCVDGVCEALPVAP